MTYRERVVALADRTSRQVRDIYAAYSGDDIGGDEFVALTAATVGRANSRARVMALAGLSAAVLVAVRRPVPTPRIAVVDDAERLTKAARTVLATAAASPVPDTIVARLGRAEPLTAAAETYSAAIAAIPHVTGWTRQLGASSCQLCEWWAADGKVFPADTPMPTHPGCSCTQQIITR